MSFFFISPIIRSTKKVFRGGVFGSSVTLSSKTIETSLFVTNALAMVVPSELFVIAIFLSCFIVTNNEVSIILEDNVALDPDTPPLKTFFVDRIIGEMKKKDVEQVESGVIKKDDIINCVINDNGGRIREIIIKNYRQEERVDEIINTATWSLTRMIENSA